MAFNSSEKEVIGAVSERLKALASGVSGARARSLNEQASLLDRLLEGEAAADLKTEVQTPTPTSTS